ncbi:MoaF N-terminal domain-containing protein [Fontimonas sp. SYSU GA230001]|uniref:MoaF-related domain-containing protein n=1 Tax=Fontimonas sp. SYSU GA230001 TaxID=3142450 RepID=UPI0032B38139
MKLKGTSPYFVRLWKPVAVMALLTLVFARMSGGAFSPPETTGPTQIVGQTLRYALPSGEFVERRFVDDRSARWKIISGPRSGETGTEQVAVRMVSAGIYFVNRVEPLGGTTRSEVYNLAARTVATYVTRPDPEDPLRRIEESSAGRLEIVAGAPERPDASVPASG